MNAKKVRGQPTPVSRGLSLAMALMATAMACKNSDTITGPPPEVTPLTPEVTPPPVAPAINVAGAWLGTFTSFDFADCDANVPATATFTQDGATVGGTLHAATNGCGTSNVVIHAVVSGNRFEGAIERSSGTYHFGSGSTVSGILIGSTLTIQLRDVQRTQIPGGTMQLHR